jgi:hypothetical protein
MVKRQEPEGREGGKIVEATVISASVNVVLPLGEENRFQPR